MFALCVCMQFGMEWVKIHRCYQKNPKKYLLFCNVVGLFSTTSYFNTVIFCCLWNDHTLQNNKNNGPKAHNAIHCFNVLSFLGFVVVAKNACACINENWSAKCQHIDLECDVAEFRVKVFNFYFHCCCCTIVSCANLRCAYNSRCNEFSLSFSFTRSLSLSQCVYATDTYAQWCVFSWMHVLCKTSSTTVCSTVCSRAKKLNSSKLINFGQI